MHIFHFPKLSLSYFTTFTTLAICFLVTQEMHAQPKKQDLKKQDLKNQDLKPWPKAKEGMVRHVITLPKQKKEDDLKVELVIGKTLHLEERNHYFMSGDLEEKTIEGWGYTYFELTKVGPLAGTLIAVDPGAPKIDRFIHIRSQQGLIRYNSKLPVVVYAPKDVEVFYRVWTAGEAKEAKQK